MNSRANSFRAFPVLLAFLINLVIGPLAPLAQTSPVAALSGTSFNATDGNLVDNGALETDWCTPAPNRDEGFDTLSGATDTSFSSSNNKEDSDVPTLSLGTIPNNKDDLLREYVASETINGDLFVYLAWIRADSTGTSTIDFEFNQSDQVSSNGVTKIRTDGDLLVTFDFQANPGSQGGYSVNLELRTWSSGTNDQPDPTSTPPNKGQWINVVDLDASGLAEGSVNGSDVTDCVSGDVTLTTGTFGEAALNLSDILGGSCKSFGSLFTKSRSSNSFSADLKDRIDPLPVNFNTCGEITILKQDEHQQPLGGATFSVSPDPFDGLGTLSVTDNSAPDDNSAPGVIHLSDVEPGTYTVCETAAPVGYILANPACAPAQTVVDNGSVTFGPFTNGLGDISWQKLDAETGAKLCCATFTLAGISGTVFGPLTVVDNGLNDEDADAGELLVTDLFLGTYRITETVAPAGYDLPSPAFQDVVLSGQTASPASAFRDPPHPVLVVVKTPDDGEAQAGDPASFTMVTTNNGPGTALAVTLTDPLPAVANGWSVDSENWLGACTISGDPGDPQTLSCGPENLADDASRTVTVSTTASYPDDCHLLENLATADGSNTDPASDAGDITVKCADIDLEKSPDDGQVNAGAIASFTILVTNNGNGEARGLVVFDELPIVSNGWTIDDATLVGCVITGDPGEQQTLTCGPTTLGGVTAPSNQDWVRVVTTTTLADCGELPNEASAETQNDGSDSDTGLITVTCPELQIDKSTTTPVVNAGDQVSFNIEVENSGDGDAEGVVISDTLPSGISWSEASDDCSIAGSVLTCGPLTIASGTTFSVTVSGLTDADDCPSVINRATFTSDNAGSGASHPAGQGVQITINCPDIVVDKTGSGTVNATDLVFFEITVSNIGDGDAYDFEFTDTLPDVQNGWTLAEAPAFCELNGVALTCALNELTTPEFFADGASFTIRVEADTEIEDCGELDNLASASASNEAEEDLANNSDEHSIVVECPDLDAFKEADDAVVSAGQDIGFTITVSNADLAATGTAYDVDLNDPLPAGSGVDWAILPAYAGPGTCQILGAPGAEMLSCHFGDLAPGASASVHVVSDTAAASCGLYHNVATITSDNHPNLTPSADTTVECPGMNVTKVADKSPIDAGETASYTMVVWNSGPGTAFGATFHDELPDDVNWTIQLLNGDADDACSVSSSAVPGQPVHWSADCQFGDLPATSMANGKQIRISGVTDRADCGTLDNDAFADADNDDRVGPAEASITVKCPTISVIKVNNQPNPVLPGTVVSYTVTVTVSDGPAEGVVATDKLPAGLDAPTSISNGGVYSGATRTITWNLGDLANGSYALTYQAAVSAGTAQGASLVNLATVTSPNSQCPNAGSIAPECDDDSTVTVRVPTLVVDKAASTEVVHFVFDSDGNVLSVTPATVTWTLTYTLTNGPVTNAVITDPLPGFLNFVSASNGGTFAVGVITWNLGTLSASGSVSFVTTVDPDAPETSPIVNVATIDSNETAPDQGQDSIRVTSESELAGTSTPAPSVPNTAIVHGPNGEPISIPVELMVVLFLGSLGTLALANVRAARRRR